MTIGTRLWLMAVCWVILPSVMFAAVFGILNLACYMVDIHPESGMEFAMGLFGLIAAVFFGGEADYRTRTQ